MLLLLGSTTFLKLLGLIFAYLMPPMGKESIIPIGVVVLGIDPLVMALSITFWDLTVALFLLWNFNFIRLVPVLGPWVAKAECKSGNYLERKTWVRRLATAGLALYCCIPLEGSGAVVGTIVGNLIGLRPRMIVLAILAGTLTSTMVIAYFADVIIDIFNGM